MSAEREYYTDFNAIPVKSRVVRNLPLPAPLPFADKHIKSLGIVTTELPHAGADGVHLTRISTTHGRSYEVRFGQNRGVFFADEFGNTFSSLTTKGNNLSDPMVEMRDRKRVLHARGLLTLNDTLHAIQTSEDLRRNRVDTDYILALLEPTEFPVDGSMVSIRRFKQSLLKKATKDMSPDTFDFVILSGMVRDARFLIELRAQAVPERQFDMTYGILSTDDVGRVYPRLFRYVNTDEKNKTGIQFNADSPEDIYTFLTDYYPKRMGRNFARFHSADYYHQYPSFHNITGIGGIVDLQDMVHIGTLPNDKKQALKDEQYKIVLMQGLSAIDHLFRWKLVESFGKDYKAAFAKNYVSSYEASVQR